MSSIPPELSDYVIDFLHDDRPSLKACSLTCRTWHPAARHHLFRTVTFSSPRSREDFQQLLHAAPYIGQFARDVRLGKWSPYVAKGEIYKPEQLSMIFCALPAVERLELVLVEMDAVLESSLIRHFTSVTQLSLEYCRFPAFGALVGLLRSFPALERLSLRGVSWEKVEEVAFPARPNSVNAPALRNLVLAKDMELDVLVEWMLSEGLCDNLETFSGSCKHDADAIIIGDLLRAAGPSLINLELDWYCASYNDIFLPLEFTVAPCTSLQILTLNCPIDLHATLPWVSSLLSQVCPASLQKLAFGIRLLGSLDAIDWKRVEAILSPDIFKKFNTLQFSIAAWHTASQRGAEVQSSIRQRLPQLASAGKVCFVC